MSDQPEQPTDTTSAAPEEEKTDWKAEAESLRAEAEKWKAWSRTHEQRAKENADAARKWQEAEDAKKPEIERLTSQLQQLTEEASRLRKTNAVVASGLDASLAEFITATDDDGIKAQVAKLASLKTPEPAVTPSTGPKGAEGYQGPPGDRSKATEADGAELYRNRKNK